MIKTLILSLIFCGIGFDAASQEKSTITFAITQVGGIKVEGEILEFSANICFNEADLENAKGTFSFNLASATTGVEERDIIMQAPEWLDTAKFPEGGFDLESLSRTNATGMLTLKGQSRQINFPVTIKPAAGLATGNFTIDRRDFKIGDGRWGMSEKWVNYEIRISFKIAGGLIGDQCD